MNRKEIAGLSRPNDRVIAGVCAAIGNRFGMSHNTVRLLFILSCLIPGPQFLIYIAAWIIIPDDRRG